MVSKHYKITSLGGCGKIGGNSFLVEGKACRFLIDAGIEFPFEKCFGIDYLVPPFEKYSIPESLILTHAHEDHIGAIPYLLSLKPNLIVYAPEFAANLLRKKLSYQKLRCKIIVYESFVPMALGDTFITPLPLPHSIPDTYGLAISHSDQEIVFYASDFSLSRDASETLTKLSEYSKSYAHRYLFCDSTSIQSRKTPNRKMMEDELDTIIAQSSSRVLVTCFASNIERIELIARIAKKYKRKICTYGRSMNNYVDVAVDSGQIDESLLTDVESFDQDDLVILISGCQGDFRSTLRRIASGDDPKIIPDPRDTFVFSSKTIPGNEIQINYIHDQLSQTGCCIITPDTHTTHISGHASQEELSKIYCAFKPTHAIPIHGNHYHLMLHRHFIEECFPKTAPIELHSGHSLRTGPSPIIDAPKDDHKMNIVQNSILLSRDAIKERRKIATQGLLVVSINLESIGSRKIKFQIEARGLPELSQDSRASLENIIRSTLTKKKGKALDLLKQEITQATRVFLKSFYNSKPITIIHFT